MGSATTTTLTSSASPWVYGQSVTFTATVTVSGPGGGPASGAVVFMDGNTPLGMVALDAPGNAAFTTAAMGLGDHTISAFYRGSVTQVLLPSGSDSIEHQVNPATPTDLTINSFTMDDQGQIQISYTVGNASAPPFSIGVYGSPDGAHLGDLLQTYEVSDPQFLTVGPQTVTFPADFSDGDPGNYLIAVLDPGDDVYETSRAGNVGNLSLAGTATAFRNGDDGNVYVFAEGCWWNNVAVTQDPTSGDVYVAVSSDSYYNGYTFSNASNVYVYSPGGSTVSIDPGVTAPVSVYAGPGSTVTGPAANLPERRPGGRRSDRVGVRRADGRVHLLLPEQRRHRPGHGPIPDRFFQHRVSQLQLHPFRRDGRRRRPLRGDHPRRHRFSDGPGQPDRHRRGERERNRDLGPRGQQQL